MMRRLPRQSAPLAVVCLVLLTASACAPAGATAAGHATPTVSAIAPTATPFVIPTITITTGSDWIPLRSTSPADLVAAARDTLPQTFLGGDSFDITSSTPAGTPALVLSLRTSEFPHPFDYVVTPFLQGDGAVDVVLELNSDHSAFRQAGEFAGGPLPQGVLWQYSVAQAEGALQMQRGITPASGFQPVLVCWMVNFGDIETGAITWTGGLVGPTHPVWLLRGADGVYYILANSGHIYALSEMPLHTLPPAGY